MRAVKLTYSRTYQVVEYQPETFTLEIELDKGDNIDEAIRAAKLYFKRNRTGYE